MASQTSIVFSLEEGPGVLFKALAVFALRQINLTKVVFIFLSRRTIKLFGLICDAAWTD